MSGLPPFSLAAAGERLVAQLKQVFLSPNSNGALTLQQINRWIETKWGIPPARVPKVLGMVGVATAAMIGAGAYLLNVQGHYRVAVRPHWKSRTLPQLIETAFALQTITELRGDPLGVLPQIRRLCRSVQKYRYRRILFGIEQLIKPRVYYRLVDIFTRLWPDGNPMIAESDAYFGYFQEMRLIFEPDADDLDRWVIGGYANRGMSDSEYTYGTPFILQSFLTPEMVMISMHAKPAQIINRLVDYMTQGYSPCYEERVFLRSRPEQTMQYIRALDPHYFTVDSPLYDLGREIDAILTRYAGGE